MKRRTTIEIDDELLARAKRALGVGTTRATVEEALRMAAERAEKDHGDRRARQIEYLRMLAERGDLAALREEMWR